MHKKQLIKTQPVNFFFQYLFDQRDWQRSIQHHLIPVRNELLNVCGYVHKTSIEPIDTFCDRTFGIQRL